MGQFDWTKYRETSGSQYIAWNDIGDQVVGRIIDIRDGNDFNNNPCPELVLDTGNGESRILKASQRMLYAALTEKAPQVGDRIRVTYTANGTAAPGRTAPKLFTVDVKADNTPLPDDDAPF